VEQKENESNIRKYEKKVSQDTLHPPIHQPTSQPRKQPVPTNTVAADGDNNPVETTIKYSNIP
jgi:hypothetical protein